MIEDGRKYKVGLIIDVDAKYFPLSMTSSCNRPNTQAQFEERIDAIDQAIRWLQRERDNEVRMWRYKCGHNGE